MSVKKSGRLFESVLALGLSVLLLTTLFTVTASPVTTNAIAGTLLFDVSKYGAKVGDLIDDTVAIRKAIDAARAAGGGTVFFPAGTYIVDLILDGTNAGSNIILKGDGNAILKLKSQKTQPLNEQFGIIVVEGPTNAFTNIVIDGLIFDGNKAEQSQTPMETGDRAKQYYALFRVWKNPDLSAKVDHITIKNSTFRNGIAAGIELEGVNDVTVQNVDLLNNGYFKKLSDGKLRGVADGIYVVGSNIVVSDVTAKDNADTNITLEGMGTWGTALIEDCVISGNSEAGLTIAGNKYSASSGKVPSHDVTVNNCNIQMVNRDQTVYSRGSRAILIESFTTDDKAPKNVEIMNTYVGKTDWSGILVKGTNISIHNNVLENHDGSAITLASGTNYTIKSNDIRSSEKGIKVASTAIINTVTFGGQTFTDVGTPYYDINKITNLKWT